MLKCRREIGEDFFETPRSAIEPIRPYIPQGVRRIWEPTYGKGAIARVLEEWGYEVMGSDKYPKTDNVNTIHDFLTDPLQECDMIIFNPPFCLKTAFLQRACEACKPFLFICPVTVLETRTRFSLFRDNHLSILNLPNRVNYLGKEESKNKVWFQSVWVMKHPEYQDRILYPDS
jgi:hypothetical protein